MGKRVVVIASGETERRSLPHLVKDLEVRGTTLADVRIPPRNQTLTPDMGVQLIKAAWYSNLHEPPDKFVLLLDADGKDPETVVGDFEQRVPNRIGQIDVNLLYCCAQRHLEAWFFGDAARLRAFLGRNLGSVDTSRPDEIDNPKLHLKLLLDDRVYTARVSERIARQLVPSVIAQRSPSFAHFVGLVANGGR